MNRHPLHHRDARPGHRPATEKKRKPLGRPMVRAGRFPERRRFVGWIDEAWRLYEGA